MIRRPRRFTYHRGLFFCANNAFNIILLSCHASKTHAGSGVMLIFCLVLFRVVLVVRMTVWFREFFAAFFCICGCISTLPFVGHVGQVGRRSSHRLDTDYLVRPFRLREAVLISLTLGTRPSPSGTSDWLRVAKARSMAMEPANATTQDAHVLLGFPNRNYGVGYGRKPIRPTLARLLAL